MRKLVLLSALVATVLLPASAEEVDDISYGYVGAAGGLLLCWKAGVRRLYQRVQAGLR